MHLRKRMRDGQPETEPPVQPRSRTICLAKSIEHMRQKIRIYPDAFVFNHEARLKSFALRGYVDLPARLRKLYSVRNKVPGNLLQAYWLTHQHQWTYIQINLQFNIARRRCCSDSINRSLHCGVQIHRTRFEVKLPGGNARGVQKIINQARLKPGIALYGVESLSHAATIQTATAKQLYPAHYRSKRSSQFVRKRREKHILRTIGFRQLVI